MNISSAISEDRDLSAQLRNLSDLDLISQTANLARDERTSTIKILHHLNEIARRKLYLDLGYSSLWDYCVRGLKYSGAAAGRRIQAARCIEAHSPVLAMLESGDLDLSTIALIEPFLTEDNREVMLQRVRGRSYRQVKRVAAEYGPPVVVEERIEPVRAVVTASDVDGVLFERQLARSGNYPRTPGAGSWVASTQKVFVQFLASEDLMEKYEEAKALLSNSHPDASFAEVLAVLLDEFVERHSPAARQRRREKRRTAAGGKSSTVGADGKHERSDTTRHIPARTRDEVFTRDAGQCTYVGADGTRCQARHGLQVDHLRPRVAGGGHEASNLRLLCGAHNRLAAEQTLGKHVMEPYWRRE